MKELNWAYEVLNGKQQASTRSEGMLELGN
jgi:hypothetical protein